MSEITDLFDQTFRPLGEAIAEWIEGMPPEQLRMAKAKVELIESEVSND